MKNYIFPHFIILLTVLLITSCSPKGPLLSQQKEFHTAYGSYSIQRFVREHSNNSKPIIFGYIYGNDTNKPIYKPAVQLNNGTIYRGNSTGYYEISIIPGKYHLIGKGYPYMFVTTMPIVLKAGDSLQVDFHLNFNNTPLH